MQHAPRIAGRSGAARRHPAAPSCWWRLAPGCWRWWSQSPPTAAVQGGFGWRRRVVGNQAGRRAREAGGGCDLDALLQLQGRRGGGGTPSSELLAAGSTTWMVCHKRSSVHWAACLCSERAGHVATCLHELGFDGGGGLVLLRAALAQQRVHFVCVEGQGRGGWGRQRVGRGWVAACALSGPCGGCEEECPPDLRAAGEGAVAGEVGSSMPPHRSRTVTGSEQRCQVARPSTPRAFHGWAHYVPTYQQVS